MSVHTVCPEKASDKVTFERGPEGNQGVIQAGTWGKSIPCKGHGRCKGPETDLQG